jgi:hypothetical protein
MNDSQANNALIATSILLALIDRAAVVSQLIQAARSQGRDISTVELDDLVAEDDVAKAALDEAIATAKKLDALDQITGTKE